MKWLAKLIENAQNSELGKTLAKARGRYLSNVLDGMSEENQKKVKKMLEEDNEDNQ